MSGQSKELVRLVSVPRGKTDELRVSVDEFIPDTGSAAQYVSVRVWFRGNAGIRPGKSGTTIRRGELRTVIEALMRAERVLTGKAATTAKSEPADLNELDQEGVF